MKNTVMILTIAGMVTHLAAADVDLQDAEFLFGNDRANVVSLEMPEMVKTEGQVLGLLDPVLGLAEGGSSALESGNLVSPVIDLTSGLLNGNAAGPLLGLVTGLPLVGDILGLLDLGALLGLVPAILQTTQPVMLNLEAGQLINLSPTSLPTLLGGIL